jgi:hypothetical protein
VPLALVVYVPLAVVTVLVEYLIENDRLAYFMSLFIALAGAFWVRSSSSGRPSSPPSPAAASSSAAAAGRCSASSC